MWYQYLIVISVILFPIVFFYIIYKDKIESKSTIALNSLLSPPYEIQKDLSVWIKNSDSFKRKGLFDFNTYQNTYDFYECDLILNSHNLVLVGKTKILGKKIALMPTIIRFKNQKKIFNDNGIRTIGKDLEIDFFDPLYPNYLTLVIKEVDNSLKEKIIKNYGL